MKKYIAFLAVTVALLAFTGHQPPATAQTGTGTPVAALASADDTSIAMLVRYVGSANSATVAVAAGGDLTFQVSAAAYTGFECPVSGALGGIIDVSDAACDTLGEVVDVINGYCTGCSSDFRAVLVDGLRSDSSNDSLLTFGTTQVTRSDGYPLYFDTDVIFMESRAMIPVRDNIATFMSPQGRLQLNPSGGTQTQLFWAEGKSTYGSGTSILYVYSVRPKNVVGAPGSEVVTTLWAEAMGATTVNKQFTQFQYIKPRARANEKMIVRITNSAAMASVNLMANGEITRTVP